MRVGGCDLDWVGVIGSARALRVSDVCVSGTRGRRYIPYAYGAVDICGSRYLCRRLIILALVEEKETWPKVFATSWTDIRLGLIFLLTTASTWNVMPFWKARGEDPV